MNTNKNIGRTGSGIQASGGRVNAPAPAGAASKPASVITETKPAHNAIQARAYQLFLARTAQGLSGTPEQDWARAERELASS